MYYCVQELLAALMAKNLRSMYAESLCFEY